MAVPETETRSKGGKLIALTFDDGPGPYTRRLLEGLAKRGVKATFFMLGQQAENYDVTAGLVRDAGHQIASHTYDHPQLSKKTDSQVADQPHGRHPQPHHGLWHALSCAPALRRL